MHRLLVSFFGLLLFSMPALGQANARDSQTLQALIEEVRQLRQDVKTTAVANQKMQVLLYRLQAQQAAVARASQRVDDAHADLNQLESERSKVAVDVKQHEDFLSRTDVASGDRAAVEDALPALRSKLNSLDNEQQETRDKMSSAEEQLHSELAKLDGLEADLSRVEKSLETANQAAGSHSE
jgi:chromosome segregation ATPase